MSLKNICILTQREIDSLEDKILEIKKNIARLNQDISDLKQIIILNNSHLIGKPAIVEDENCNKIILSCKSIRCGDDYEPIFYFNDKKDKKHFTFVEWVK